MGHDHQHEGEDSDDRILRTQGAQGVTQDILGRFIENSMSMRTIPLPILKRVDRGCFVLNNYLLDHGNFQSFLGTLPGIVPKNVQKVFLVNNSLKDTTMFQLFDALAGVRGLR